MSVLQPSVINMAVPEYKLDQIIGVFTNTINLPAPTASPGYVTATDPRAHGFGDSCYFQGIFTTDGGVTWNDFGAQTPNLAAPNPQFQTVDVEAYADTTNVNIYITSFYDTAHSSGTARTVTYKLYLLAKNTMNAKLTPLPTSQILAYASKYNFQKIFKQGTTSFTAVSGFIGSASVFHNLGYTPKVRAFFLPTANPTQVYSLSQITIPPVTSPIIEAQITSSAVTFVSDQSGFPGANISGNIEWRIYLDS